MSRTLREFHKNAVDNLQILANHSEDLTVQALGRALRAEYIAHAETFAAGGSENDDILRGRMRAINSLHKRIFSKDVIDNIVIKG